MKPYFTEYDTPCVIGRTTLADLFLRGQRGRRQEGGHVTKVSRAGEPPLGDRTSDTALVAPKLVAEATKEPGSSNGPKL